MRGSLGIAAAALLLAACPSEDKPTGNTSGDPSANSASASSGTSQPCGELGQTFTNADCGACAEAQCCMELKTCDDNGACGELLTCRAACVDQACVNQCNSEFGSGTADLDALDVCLAGPCAADCPTSTGICDTMFSFGSQECDTCLGDNCCAPLKDCLAQQNCNDCMTTGNGTDCTMDTYFQTVTSCFSQSCGQLCPE